VNEEQRLKLSKKLNPGFPRLQQMLKFTTYKYYVLAARPGLFKSTFAWNVAWNLASTGHTVLWVSLEMSPGQMALMALSRLSGIDRDTVGDYLESGRVPVHHSDQWRTGYARVGSISTLIFHEKDNSLAGILDSMNKVRYDCVLLDYLQLVNAGCRNEFENISATSKALAWHAHNRGPMVMALSQLNREIDRITSLRFPRLSDLKGSSQIEQDADAVMFLHDPGTDPSRDRNKFSCVVEKNRYGRAGLVALRAHPATAFIEEEGGDDDA
jgi:replicative DNA helicase